MIDFSLTKPIDVIENWGLSYHYGRILEIIHDGNNLKNDLGLILYIYDRQKDLSKFIYMKNKTTTVKEIVVDWNLSQNYADVIDGIYEVATTLRESVLDDAMNRLREQLEKL